MKEKIKNSKILISVTALFIIVASIVAVNIITDKSDNIQTATGTSNSGELEIIDESSYESTSTPEITTETKVDEDVIDDDLVVNTENENVTIEEDKNGNQIAIIKDDNGEEVKVAVKKDKNGKTVVDTTKKIVTDKDNNYVVKDNSETSDGNTESTTTIDPKTHKVVVKETTPAETKTTTNDSSNESNKTTTKTTTAKPTTTTTAKSTTTAKTTEAPKTTTTKTTTTKKTTTDKSQYPDDAVGPVHEEPAKTATTTTKVTTTPKVTEAPKTTTTTTAKKAEAPKTTVTECIHANIQPIYREEPISAWDETITVKKTSFKCRGCGLFYCDVEEAWNNKDEATLKKLYLTDITDKKIIDNVNKYSLLTVYSDAYDCYTSHCGVCHGGSSWTTSSKTVNEIIHHEAETTLVIDHYYCPDCKKEIY